MFLKYILTTVKKMGNFINLRCKLKRNVCITLYLKLKDFGPQAMTKSALLLTLQFTVFHQMSNQNHFFLLNSGLLLDSSQDFRQRMTRRYYGI